MKLERAADSTEWHALLDFLSRDGVHGSWRRSALLALVHSEIGLELLNRVSSVLTENGGRLLRELVRTVTAVDVEPASKRLIPAGVDPAIIPASWNVPSGTSWPRLILWLLALGDDASGNYPGRGCLLRPAWSMGFLGKDPYTPTLVAWLYRWLTNIETIRGAAAINHEQGNSLRNDLRVGFLMFCSRNPPLAAALPSVTA